ncbi:hypothetical protein H5410_064983 [Solanum commersonii]|uniref:Protein DETOXIFICATION n=1 Tax=Solanum commersonii TaxID=4109 RepID=A0A9J5VXW0_SOLCO|nr:hypothetical protein H5410_064983 [Solanum commersonii]
MASALETLCGQAYGAKQYTLLGVYLQRSLPEAVAKLTGKVAIWLIPMHLSFPFQFTLVKVPAVPAKTVVIAWVSVGTLALHVVLCWIFLYKLGFGIVGTALILDISWWISVLGLLVYIVLWVPSFLVWFLYASLLAFGIFSSSLWLLGLENIYFRVLVIVSGHMNNTEVAVDALSICITIIGWESMIPLGFLAATGVQLQMSLELETKPCKVCPKVALLNTLALGILFWSIVMVFPDKLSMIFTSSIPVIKMVGGFAFLLATTILCNCVQPVLSGKQLDPLAGTCGICQLRQLLFSRSALWYIFWMATKLWINGLMVRYDHGDSSSNLDFSDYDHQMSMDHIKSMNINGWEMMTPLAFFAATGVRVANELGAGRGKAAKFATAVSVIQSTIIGLIFCVLIMIYQDKFALIFSSSFDVLKAFKKISYLLAFTILLNSVQPVLSGVAVGSGWQSKVAYINLGCYYLVGVPLGILMGMVLHTGLEGMWAGMIFGGTALQTIVLAFITYRSDWEKEARKARMHVEKWSEPTPVNQS